MVFIHQKPQLVSTPKSQWITIHVVTGSESLTRSRPIEFIIISIEKPEEKKNTTADPELLTSIADPDPGNQK
jgi:hypothetical protein